MMEMVRDGPAFAKTQRKNKEETSRHKKIKSAKA